MFQGGMSSSKFTKNDDNELKIVEVSSSGLKQICYMLRAKWRLNVPNLQLSD